MIGDIMIAIADVDDEGVRVFQFCGTCNVPFSDYKLNLESLGPFQKLVDYFWGVFPSFLKF